jgi:hypothetical protein
MEFVIDHPALVIALMTVTVFWGMVLRGRWRQARRAEDRVRYDPGRYS